MVMKKVTIAHLGFDDLSQLALDDLAARVDAHQAEAPRLWLRVSNRLLDEQVRRLAYHRGQKSAAAPAFTLPRLTPAELDAAFKSSQAIWQELAATTSDTDSMAGAQARALSMVVGRLGRALYNAMRLAADDIALDRLAKMQAASTN